MVARFENLILNIQAAKHCKTKPLFNNCFRHTSDLGVIYNRIVESDQIFYNELEKQNTVETIALLINLSVETKTGKKTHESIMRKKEKKKKYQRVPIFSCATLRRIT